MVEKKSLLDVLLAVNTISQDDQLTFAKKLELILGEITACLQTKSGSIMLLKDRTELEVVAATKKKLVGIRQPLTAKSPSAWVVTHQKPLYIKDDSERTGFSPASGRYNKGAFFLAPIMGNQTVIGVISVTSKMGSGFFSDEDRDALLTIAGHVISALENQRLAASLSQQKEILERQNKKLKALEKLKNDLFNMLIHDLKGPLSSVIASLDILSYTVSAEDRESVDIAMMGCDSLHEMVANLLDIARMEEDRFKLMYQKIIPEDLVKEALARLHGQAQLKQVTLEPHFPEKAGPAHFLGDRAVLLRVLQNLLSNAITHSPAETLISAGYGVVSGNKIDFFVKDHGPGIAPEHCDAIFNKFFQLEKKQDGGLHTTGLGLTFCKMAVSAHKGDIQVESDGQNGSRFFFRLPITIDPTANTDV
jgi:K+-sensing histidine kinase KdpD